MIFGEPLYGDFGLRADDVIRECGTVPPGTPICLVVGDKYYRVCDVDKEFGEPRPEWRELKDEELVPTTLYLIAKI